MTGEIGLNGPADARLASNFFALLGAEYIRVVLLPDIDLTPWVADAHARGMSVLGVVARESLVGSFEETAAFYAQRYGDLFEAIQPGNEPDLSSPRSWTLTANELNDLLSACNQHFSQAIIVGPGLASGQPSYLDAVDLDLMDAVGLNIYDRRPDNTGDWSELPGNFGTVGSLLDSYRYHKKEIWVTEVGVSTTECSPEFQARYCEAILKALKLRADVPVAMWFAADDAMVSEFGLFDVNGNPKQSAAAYIRASGYKKEEEPVPDTTYTVGKGVLEKMTADGTAPGSDECYYPVGVQPSQWSETMALNGTIYRYLFATDTVHRYRQDAA